MRKGLPIPNEEELAHGLLFDPSSNPLVSRNYCPSEYLQMRDDDSRAWLLLSILVVEKLVLTKNMRQNKNEASDTQQGGTLIATNLL